MRVLVTNTQHQQAYAIVCGLRPYAQRIVATAHGRNRVAALLASAFRSRLVDARYRLPQPPKPWLEPRPTQREERYVAGLLAICRRERIDIIVPSNDRVVYILSRQKARFAERGVAVAVCDFEVQSRMMNKVWTLREAERAGIPIPRTHVPATRRELDEAISDVGLPAVLKPAFDAGGEGLRWATRRRDLDRLWRPPQPGQPDLLVQEYIPGPGPLNARTAFVVVGRRGECRAMFTHLRLRYARWAIGLPHAASVGTTDTVIRQQTLALLRHLGFWGAACVEWKRDPRDGRTKLLEPNGRIGASAWPALASGVNIPLITAREALGLRSEPAVDPYDGRFYIDPFGEILAAATYCVHAAARVIAGRGAPPPADVVPTWREHLRWVARSYLTGRRVYSDVWRGALTDPWPFVLYWAEQFVYVLRHHRDFLPRR